MIDKKSFFNKSDVIVLVVLLLQIAVGLFAGMPTLSALSLLLWLVLLILWSVLVVLKVDPTIARSVLFSSILALLVGFSTCFSLFSKGPM